MAGLSWAGAGAVSYTHLDVYKRQLYVGAVWTNPRSAFLAPLVFAMFVYGLPQQTWRGLGAGLAWAALGGVLGMVVQGVLSLSLGGPFWYFMAEVSEVQNYDLHDVRFEPLEHWCCLLYTSRCV